MSNNNRICVLSAETIANALKDRHINKVSKATGLSTYDIKSFRDMSPRAEHIPFSKRVLISDYIEATGATASEQPNG